MPYIALLTYALSAVAVSPTGTNQDLDWGRWNTVSCHPGLDFRIGHSGQRMTNGKYVVVVQFRNRYRRTIFFSYVLREPGAQTDLKYRTYDGIPAGGIGPGEERRPYSPEFFVDIPPGGGSNVLVQRVRFGRDSGPYTNCQR